MEEKGKQPLRIDLSGNERLLAAVSGGADSVALLLLTDEAGALGAVAHCNFHLRGEESDRDERFVRSLCERRGVKLFVRHFDTTAEAERSGESIEMAARRLRYEWFAELCREERLTAVAVAHHRDDNAETVLLNLLRGTGLKGLTGMRRERNANGLRVLRPLLDFSKEDILAYLKEKGQDYVTDSTNADTHFRRNKIRNEILPLLRTVNPRIEQTLHETARRLADSERLCRYAAGQLRGKMVTPLFDDGEMEIDCAALQAAPAAADLLHEWLAPYGFTATQTEKAAAMRTGGVLETAGWLLTRTHRALELRRRPAALAPTALPATAGEVTLPDGRRIILQSLDRDRLKEIPKHPTQAAVDAGRVKGTLRLRPPRPGDRFRPFGMKGTQLVSDYLSNRHRSRIDKLSALVITDDEGLVWLVGERIDERFRITEQTKKILLIQIIP